MNKQVKVEASKPIKDLDQWSINLFITRKHKKRLGVLWLDSKIEAEQVTEAILKALNSKI